MNMMRHQSAQSVERVEALRDALIQARARESIRLSDVDEIMLQGGGDEMDLARCFSDAETHNVLTEHRLATLSAIDAAIDRIRDGSYGFCEECDEEISIERLQVLPFTSCCVDCQQAREAGWYARENVHRARATGKFIVARV